MRKITRVLLLAAMIAALMTFTVPVFAQAVTESAEFDGQKYATLAEAVNAAEEKGGGIVTLLADTEVSETITINKNITISGEHTITWADSTKSMFTVSSGATLTLDGGVTLNGANNWVLDEELYNQYLNQTDPDSTDSLRYAVMNNVNGTEMYPVTSENGKSDFGATAHLIKNNGTLNVNNATIKDFFSFKVYNNKNTYAATSGYSVIYGTNNSVTNLNAGALIQHNASGSGGVVVNNDSCTWDTAVNRYTEVNVNGATIQNNFAGSNGGMFKIYRTTLNIMSGKIYNNKATDSNGSVVMLYGAAAILNMEGGEICSNSSVYGYNNGRTAAVYPHASSTFNMKGGSICHNTGFSRGGLYVNYNAGKINITDGNITDNNNIRGDEQKDIYCGPTAALVFNITGGTFTQDVTAWCVDGLGALYNENTGLYSIHHHNLKAVEAKEPTCGIGWIAHMECSVCGGYTDSNGKNLTKEEVELAPVVAEHTPSQELTVVSEPSCSEKGTANRLCAVCDTVLEQDISLEMTVHTPTVVNKKDVSCDKDGYTGDTVCSVCNEPIKQGENIEATGHSFGKWKVVKKATTSAEGLKERECSVCKDKQTEKTAKLKEENPDTFDSVGTFALLFTLSAGAGALLKKQKKY